MIKRIAWQSSFFLHCRLFRFSLNKENRLLKIKGDIKCEENSGLKRFLFSKIYFNFAFVFDKILP